jgi:hypothetical protein
VAIDGLAERFGVNVVKRAEDLTKPAATPLAVTLDYLEDQTSAGPRDQDWELSQLAGRLGGS